MILLKLIIDHLFDLIGWIFQLSRFINFLFSWPISITFVHKDNLQGIGFITYKVGHERIESFSVLVIYN